VEGEFSEVDVRVYGVLTAGCVDVDPHTLCMHDRSSGLLGGTVCSHHAIRANYTEIRCQKSVTQGVSSAKFGRYFFYRVVPPRPSLTHKKEAPPWGRA
jgi:hypothetical protein